MKKDINKAYFITDTSGKHYCSKKSCIPTEARDFLGDSYFKKQHEHWYSALLVERLNDGDFEEVYDGKTLPHNVLSRIRTYKTENKAKSFINKILMRGTYHLSHYQEYIDYYKGNKWSKPEVNNKAEYQKRIAKHLQWVKDNLRVATADINKEFSIAFATPEHNSFETGHAINQFCHRCGMCVKGFKHFHVSRNMSNVNLCSFCIVEISKEAEQNLQQLGTDQVESINKQRFIQKLTQL